MLIIMDGNDSQYLRWLRENPKGYVLNARRKPDAEYIVLHRSNCHSISHYTANARPGGFTERDFIKVCSDSLPALRKWAQQNGRPDSSFSKECSMCNKIKF